MTGPRKTSRIAAGSACAPCAAADGTPHRETALLVAAWVVVTVVLVRAGVTGRPKVVGAEMTTVNRVASVLILGGGPLLTGLWLLSPTSRCVAWRWGGSSAWRSGGSGSVWFRPGELGVVVDLLTLLEVAWRDVHGEPSPPEEIVDDVLLVSKGTLAGLVRAAALAVGDWRDLKLRAGELRGERP